MAGNPRGHPDWAEGALDGRSVLVTWATVGSVEASRQRRRVFVLRSSFVVRRVAAVVAAMVIIAVSCGPSTATPSALRDGRNVYGDKCSSCHGSRGQGGVGPSLSHVRDTWPSCDDHQEWIALGSEDWKAEYGPLYGANEARITKVMPGQAAALTRHQIAAVAAFQRVEYGGGDAATELAACGLPDD